MILEWGILVFSVSWRTCNGGSENHFDIAICADGGFSVSRRIDGRNKTLSRWSTLEKAKQFCQDMVDNKSKNWSTGDFQPTHDWSGR